MNGLILNKKSVHPLLICLSCFYLFFRHCSQMVKSLCRSKSEWSYSSSFPFVPFCSCLSLNLKRWDHLLVPFIGVIRVSRKFCLLHLSGASVFCFLWNLTSEQGCNIQKNSSWIDLFQIVAMVIPYWYREKMKKGKECVAENSGEAGQTEEKTFKAWGASMAHLFIDRNICILSLVLIHLDWSHTTRLLLRRSSELFLLCG